LFDREPRFFRPRRYQLRLRWVLWGAVAVMVFGLLLFFRMLAR
jgi:hypothetical protein